MTMGGLESAGPSGRNTVAAISTGPASRKRSETSTRSSWTPGRKAGLGRPGAAGLCALPNMGTHADFFPGVVILGQRSEFGTPRTKRIRTQHEPQRRRIGVNGLDDSLR